MRAGDRRQRAVRQDVRLELREGCKDSTLVALEDAFELSVIKDSDSNCVFSALLSSWVVSLCFLADLTDAEAVVVAGAADEVLVADSAVVGLDGQQIASVTPRGD